MYDQAQKNSVRPDYVPAPLDMDNIRSLPLSPRDAYLMTLIDGETSVGDLAAMMGEPPSEVVRRWLRLETLARQVARGVSDHHQVSGVFATTLVDADPALLDDTAPWRAAAEADGGRLSDITLVDGPPSSMPVQPDPDAGLSSARELARGARAAEVDGRWLEAVNLWRLAMEMHDSEALRREHARAEQALRDQLAQQQLLETKVTLVDS